MTTHFTSSHPIERNLQPTGILFKECRKTRRIFFLTVRGRERNYNGNQTQNRLLILTSIVPLRYCRTFGAILVFCFFIIEKIQLI